MTDIDRIEGILKGGKTNDLKRSGVLVNDPDVVLVGELDGEKSTTFYGVFEISQDKLDYLFHRVYGVTIGERNEFYKEHDVSVYAYVLDGDDQEHSAVKKIRFTWSDNLEKWTKFSTETVKEKTDDVPEDVKYNKWINVGDMNPREHGGVFVKWKDGHWDMISTRMMPEKRQEAVGEKYMGMEMSFIPSEIWKNPGDLSEGLNDWVKDKMSILGMGDVDPTEADRIVTGIARIPLEFEARDFYFSNYWEEMNGRGIYKESVT